MEEKSDRPNVAYVPCREHMLALLVFGLFASSNVASAVGGRRPPMAEILPHVAMLLVLLMMVVILPRRYGVRGLVVSCLAGAITGVLFQVAFGF